MLFKVFPGNELETLYDILAGHHLVGPQLRGTDLNGQELFAFDYIHSFTELRLDFTSTVHSLKSFILPPRETLSSFTLTNGDWEKHVDLGIYKPHVFFGLHPCDINGLNKLDKVLTEIGRASCRERV